jgi:hypothetical protein
MIYYPSLTSFLSLTYIIYTFFDGSEQIQYQSGFIPIFIGIPQSSAQADRE